MVMCWAPDCKHYNQRETCKFYKFPKDEKLRNKWKKLVRRDVEPGPGAFICSCHFKDGNKENLPTIFQHNREKMFAYTSPERKVRRALKDIQEHVMEQVEEESASNVFHEEEPQPSTSQGSGVAPMVWPAEVEAENYFLKKDLQEMSAKLLKLKQNFSYEHIIGNDKYILLYTGLPNASIFNALYNLIKDVNISYYLNWKVEKVSRQDQLLLTLMKLRQNFPQEDLALCFGMSQTTVSNIVLTWIHVLHEILFKQLMSGVPSRQKNKLCLPSSFALVD